MLGLSTTNSEFVQEKLFSFTIALLFILLLTPQGVGQAYLVLGHAHFMMTALYQYKMGRMSKKSIVIYLVVFAFLFFIAYQVPRAFTLFVAVFLLFHVYMGEARHIKKLFSPVYLLMTLSIGTLLGPWLAHELWRVSIPGTALLLLAGVLACTAGYFFFRQKNEPKVELFFYTLVGLLILFMVLELSGHRPVALESFGFIVIAHYLATYFNVFRSFTRKGQGAQWPFVWESIGMNGLFLAGFILVFYFIGTHNVLYDYVYNPLSFYVWTLMHFLTTMNFKAYREKIVLLFPRLVKRSV